MKSKASQKFWKHFRQLLVAIQKLAAKQYKLWANDPGHPSLQFKKVQALWFWIGSHSEYDRLIKRR